MKNILREIRYFLDFVFASIKIALTGDRRYYVWLASLVMLVVLGTYAYIYQLMHGLIVTGMRDQVSWGLYISNFTFFVGVAASAVLIVAPLYLYNYREFEYIVTFGEFLAVAALIIALTNVLADVGRVERLWHMFPLIGTPNWPDSMLVWDVLVLNGYLFLNLLIPGYKLYKKYIGSEPSNWIKFFIFLSIPWAISIHTVTAFIYAGLSARPYWNTALMAPRFIASAFTSGPAIMILVLLIIRRYTFYRKYISEKAIETLAQITLIAMLVNLFLLLSELYTVFYSATIHQVSLKYLFFGLEHNGKVYAALKPIAWLSLFMQITSVALLLYPKTRRNFKTLAAACSLNATGIWLEKGMGLVVPGFVPTPIGEIWEYMPSFMEWVIVAGTVAWGFLVYTLMLKVAKTIEAGLARHSKAGKK